MSEPKKLPYVCDAEVMINFSCLVFWVAHAGPEPPYRFVIEETFDQRKQLKEFLRNEVAGLVGFNILGYDQFIIQHILESEEPDTRKFLRSLYNLSQSIIDDKKSVKLSFLKEIPIRDVYKIHHWDNQAKATSLKWIQCHLGMTNVQEMPYKHDYIVSNRKEVDKIVDYCRNDVDATKQIYLHPKTQELMKSRREVTAKIGVDVNNSSNASMGEWIIKSRMNLLHMTEPPRAWGSILIKDVILDNVMSYQFYTPAFTQVRNWFKGIAVDTSEEETPKYGMEISVDGVKYAFGLGGVHASVENTILNQLVDSLDVTSYYPRLAIVNNLSPRHLTGSNFSSSYNEMFDERKKMAKGTPLNLSWKEALNCVFGKSNSRYSFLYDPFFTYSITVNGQLLLLILVDMIRQRKAGKVIMVNTDGIEVIVEDRVQFDEVVRLWQTTTRLELEHVRYSHMTIRDVNNYFAMHDDFSQKIKVKGAYEVEKEFHKDPSAKVIPATISQIMKNFGPDMISKMTLTELQHTIAVEVKNRPLDEFFMYARAKTGEFVLVAPNGDRQDAPRTVRYLITTEGYILGRKTGKKGKGVDRIHKKAWVAVLNELNEDNRREAVDVINYQWYVNEIIKLLRF